MVMQTYCLYSMCQYLDSPCLSPVFSDPWKWLGFCRLLFVVVLVTFYVVNLIYDLVTYMELSPYNPDIRMECLFSSLTLSSLCGLFWIV